MTDTIDATTTLATKTRRKRAPAGLPIIPFEEQLFSNAASRKCVGLAASTWARKQALGLVPPYDVRIGRLGKYRGRTILRLMSEGIK